MGKKSFIPAAEPEITEKEIKYVNECVKSGWISSLGKFVTKFEEKFSKFCGCKYGISTSNGTTALHLALDILGIREGDEVIMPAFTFVATANAVSYLGAKPIFVDSEYSSWNIDPQKIEEKITKKTKAIIAVHLYGHPANMGPIMKLARKYQLYVIEDASEAHGALYRGKKVGSIGEMGSFSFYGNKIITTGEGGMITTNKAKWDKRARFLRDHAMSPKKRYYHPERGYNYRITNIQAAIGLAQVERINKILAKKEKIEKMYNRLLSGIKGISFQPQAPWAKKVCWMYSVLINDEFPLSRIQLEQELKKRGIDTRPFFIPMNKLPMYKTNEKFPVAEDLSRRGLSLPSSTKLNNSDIEYICNVIRKLSE
ncbi:MAG: DegT/DnrJ/EryC1/StrS family aminotransferase [Candidatus Schekmanbacteria bacterium]|nr:MAG: DegT/DnrJ/EryC1/StrS family aminotransferase [Candidatus Schekmanbacteria bacterium]